MQTNRILRWGIVLSVLAVFFTPLIVANPLFFPFITGKNFAFRILAELATLFWVLLALRDHSVRPRFSWLFFVLSAFVVAIGVADMFGANPFKSFWSNFERMEGWVGLIHLYAFFVVVWSTFREKFQWRLLFETTIFVSVIEGVYGLLQLAGKLQINQGGVRVDGTFGNAAYLAVYMLFSFFFTALALYWWGRKGKYVRWWYAVAMLLQLVMIFYTATRGTILGLTAGLLVASVIFLVFAKSAPRLRKIGIALCVVLALMAGGFYLARNSSYVQHHEVLSRIANISISDGATRFAIWSMALKGFAERPILGWGQESFNYIFNKYYEPSMYGQEAWFDRAHNEFLDWLVAGGIAGFALWVALFALALWFIWRPTSKFEVVERGLLTGLIVAYSFHDLFVFDNLLSYILFFTLLAYLAHSVEATDTSAQVTTGKVSWWSQNVSSGGFVVLAPLAIVGMGAIFYAVNVPGITTAFNLIEALKSQPKGLSANVASLKKAGETTGLGRQEVREQIVQFALQARGASIGDQAFRDGATTYAFQQMSDEVAKNPNDTRLHVFLGSFLMQIGKLDDADVELKKALALSPRKQGILFELGSLELSQGNAATALDWFRQAYELDHTYDTARTLYASALIRSGNLVDAHALLIERFNTVTPDSEDVFQSYMSIKDYPAVIAIAKERADAAPKNLKAHVQLAAVYIQSGDRLNAIKSLQDAIAIDPTFKAQGEYYIQEITAGRTP